MRESSGSSLKGRLVSGGPPLDGAFLCSFSPALAEILGHCGFDYVVVDMEHGPGDTHAALPCLQALRAAGVFSVIRIPVNDPTWAKKALDLGPDGIMIPMVESAEEAAMAISACNHPPKGIHGAARGIIGASRYGLDLDYSKRVQDNLLVMLQIESRKGVENVTSIIDVDGVDCLMMGPRDLSATMGYLENPSGDSEVNKLLHHAETTILNSKMNVVYLAGIARANDSPTSMFDRGYHMVAGAVDISLFRNAALTNVQKFKPALA
ncbi:hypothetical protein GOP47_0004715 [Adiantum capillus-veneris]|uniref:HpcH/HpaI aldolase/citrate lyase domain-containing protein n=1 Tax=Adiantum capillus-veneris TaxID=13818 RepID=A0A9D4ZPU9_ADICA|nr:hypothetical protein GOP47_0004715 [Adiantum capillus-veneris]